MKHPWKDYKKDKPDKLEKHRPARGWPVYRVTFSKSFDEMGLDQLADIAEREGLKKRNSEKFESAYERTRLESLDERDISPDDWIDEDDE